ncbi:hypothetical protein I7I48_12064 [Histoplasma ohiense]|nr:hypothetical protein I7I48_12064 [Histoplasma ohiense (nom. inval.)]
MLRLSCSCLLLPTASSLSLSRSATVATSPITPVLVAQIRIPRVVDLKLISMTLRLPSVKQKGKKRGLEKRMISEHPVVEGKSLRVQRASASLVGSSRFDSFTVGELIDYGNYALKLWILVT